MSIKGKCGYLHAVIRSGARVGHEVSGDNGVNGHKNDEWQEEEDAKGADEVEQWPEGVGLCHTLVAGERCRHVRLGGDQ